MTTHPTAVPPPAPPPRREPHDCRVRLLEIAHALVAVAEADPAPAELIGVTGAADLEGDGGLVLVTIPGPDPAAGLLGFTAPPDWWAIGVLAEARARSLDPDAGPSPDGYEPFVHLVSRDGTAMGLLSRPGLDPLVLGPYTEPVEGRTADACRRTLGLPTAPPPPMTAHLIDVWLDHVARAATRRPGLGWADVVAHHPGRHGLASASSPTPARLAAHTLQMGADLDWDRYRLGCASRGTAPFGDQLDAAVIGWMDAGMFARWQLGESLRRDEQMDLLEALLAPAATDQLWAALSLCGPLTGPSG